MGPVRTVPTGEQEAKRIAQHRDSLDKQIRDLTPIAALATNQALLTLISEGRRKALGALVLTKDLAGEGVSLQAEVKVWETITATLVKAANNLKQCQDGLAKCP